MRSFQICRDFHKARNMALSIRCSGSGVAQTHAHKGLLEVQLCRNICRPSGSRSGRQQIAATAWVMAQMSQNPQSGNVVDFCMSLLSLISSCGLEAHAKLNIGKPQMWEWAHVGFGGTGRKRKGPCMKQCAWRKHGLCDTRLAEACPPKL